MCVVSMIMDGYHDNWGRRKLTEPWIAPPIYPSPPLITPQEVEEFKRLLERAREYDKKNHEPDCELQEKKDKLSKLAEELGVKIVFD